MIMSRLCKERMLAKRPVNLSEVLQRVHALISFDLTLLSLGWRLSTYSLVRL